MYCYVIDCGYCKTETEEEDEELENEIW